MSPANQTIYNEIVQHIAKEILQSGGSISNWYAGITDDIERRLHSEHGVPKQDHWFLQRLCDSNEDAIEIEEALHEYGCDGGGNGGGQGNENTTIVYAYLKSDQTTE